MTSEIKKVTKSDLNAVIVRSNLLQGSWNFERMQALGFAYAMVPVIKRLYPLPHSKERKDALKRHMEFFNTQPFVAAPILGVTIAMEEERANGKAINDAAINGIKVGLMGPLAGVGDPIFWGTIRPVLAALGAGLALKGNLLGPLLFFILFNILRLMTRYFGVLYGYKKGLNVIRDMKSGLLQKLTEGAAIFGLFIMGALVQTWTTIDVSLVVSIIEKQDGTIEKTTVQDILNSLMPGLLPLLFTFACMWLLRCRVHVLWIIIGIFAIGIFGAWSGVLV